MRGDRVREWRLRRGYTQEELAELLGLGLRQITRYESGETDPASEIVTRIAKALGVTSDYLLGLTDEPMAYLTEEDLTPIERKLLQAYRSGELRRILSILAGNEPPETGDTPGTIKPKPE